MQEFILTLPSSVRSYDDNTVACWKTRLPSKINLPGRWEVGLKEISYPKSWYNISTRADLSMVTQVEPNITGKSQNKDKQADGPSITMNELSNVIPMGYYSSTEEVARTLNQGIQKAILQNNISNLESYPPRVEFLSYSNKIRFIAGLNRILNEPNDKRNEWTTFWFSDAFNEVLGFTNKETWSKEIVKILEPYFMEEMLIKDSNRPFEILGGIRGIYVYSNIVKPRQLGDRYAQLLRLVDVPPVSLPFGEQYTVYYENPNFVEVNTSELYEIEIELADLTGSRIPFQFGNAHVDLLFRRIT